MKRVMMLFAEGYEEVEALMTADLLKRGGVEVTFVSVPGDKRMESSRGVRLEMHTTLAEARADLASVDAVILPGGMPGTTNLAASKEVCDLLLQADAQGKIVAAICAAPSVLGKCGLLKGKRATCYPGFEEQLTGAEFVNEMTVTDGNIVTSRGLGTSMEFGFALLELLVSKEKAEEVREKIVFMY